MTMRARRMHVYGGVERLSLQQRRCSSHAQVPEVKLPPSPRGAGGGAGGRNLDGRLATRRRYTGG